MKNINPPQSPFFKGGRIRKCIPPFFKGGLGGIFRNHGFTLIEIVLTIAVLGIGIVGVLFSYQGMSRNTLRGNQSAVALNISRGTLERIFAARDTNGYSATLTAMNSGSYDENPATGFTGYVLDTTATEVNPDDDDAVDDFLDSQASSGYARVTATVTWNSGAQEVSLVTLMTNF